MLPHFKTDNFRMIRLFFNSIDTSLMVFAPEQNAATKQPPQYQSVAQFYRDLQAKGNFTANPEEIAEFITKFASKNQWCFNRHKLSQRIPENHLSNRSQNDGKVLDCYCGSVCAEYVARFCKVNTPFTTCLYPRLYSDRKAVNYLP